MGIEFPFDVVWGCSSSVDSSEELYSSLESVTLTSSGKDDRQLTHFLDESTGQLTHVLDGVFRFRLHETEGLLRVVFFRSQWSIMAFDIIKIHQTILLNTLTNFCLTM